MGTLLNRRRYMGGAKGLPYDAEIEYLEGTGTQYINTGIIPTSTMVLKVKFMNLTPTSQAIIGYTGNNAFRTHNYRNSYYFAAFGNEIVKSGGLYSNTLQESEIGNYYIKDIPTNTILASSNTPYTETGTDYIYLNGKIPSQNRFYYFQAYDGGQLILDLIPVRVGTTGYMYDKVSGQLFGNSGKGNFVLGSDKT